MQVKEVTIIVQNKSQYKILLSSRKLNLRETIYNLKLQSTIYFSKWYMFRDLKILVSNLILLMIDINLKI